MKSSNKLTIPSWLPAVAILLLAFAISLNSVNRYTIRRDELTTLGHIGALAKDPAPVPVSQTIASLLQYSSDHAPLYYVVINIWGGAFDFNYFALRILSVWFGMIAIAGTFWLGRRLVDSRTGFLAAMLLATNVLFYGNVHEMRDWTMLVMFSVLIWISYWRIIDHKKEPSIVSYMILFGLTVISLYTSYLIMFLWVTIGLYHLLALPRNRRWWKVALAVILGGCMFLPWLPQFAQGLGVAQFHIDEDNPMLLNNITLIHVASTLWGNGLLPLFLLLVGLALDASRKDWKTARPIVFFFVVMVGGLLITNEFFLFLKRVRYLVYLTVPFSLFVGYGLAMLSRHQISRYIVPLVIAIWMFSGYQYSFTDDFNEHLAKDRVQQYPEYNYLVPILRDVTEKRDLLVIAHYRFSDIQESKQELRGIHQYYMDDLKLTLTNFPLYVQWSKSGIDATPVEYATGLIPQYDEFWFSFQHTHIVDEILEFQSVIGGDYTACETIDYGYRSRLIHYVRTEKLPELCDSPQ